MNGNNDSGTDWVVSNLNSGLSRRRVIAGAATAVGGGTALTLAASQSARAEVSVDDVTVPDAEFVAADVEPVVDVDIAYAWAYDAPTEVATELLVGGDTIASESLRTGRAEFEADTTLSGQLTDSSAWSASNFVVERGETVTHDVTIGVRFAVIDGSEVVAEDTASDTATVVVEHPKDGVFAQVGMSGTITDGS